jgi:hypothetical protein
VISCAREYELKLNRQALKGGQRCLPIGSDRRSSPELLPTWRDGGRRQTRFSESCGPIRQPRGDCAIQPIRRGDPFPASASPSSTAHFPDLAIRHRGGNLELERGDTGWMPSESPFWTAAQLTLSTLGDHLKTGHTLSLQNRPTEVGRRRDCFTLPRCVFARRGLGSLK